MKNCTRCGRPTPTAELTVDRSKASGHKGWCRRCDRERCRAYYARRVGRPVRAHRRREDPSDPVA
jgi:hypothetical protein